MAKSNYKKLSDFINDYMMFRSEDSYDKYADIPQIRRAAKLTLRDISQSTDFTFKSVRLDIKNNQYVDVPNDFIGLTFIGVLDESSCQLIPLGKRETIQMAGDVLKDSNGDPLLDSEGVELLSNIVCDPDNINFNLTYDYPYFYDQYWYQPSLGRQYGQGGGNNKYGYYRYNPDDNRIELQVNSNSTQVVLEYVSDVEKQSDPLFPLVMEEAVSAGVYHRLIERLSIVPANEKERARREWFRLRRVNKAMYKAPMKQELLQISRKNTQATPKY